MSATIREAEAAVRWAEAGLLAAARGFASLSGLAEAATALRNADGVLMVLKDPALCGRHPRATPLDNGVCPRCAEDWAYYDTPPWKRDTEQEKT